MSDLVATAASARFEIVELDGDHVVLSVPGNAYAIRLRWAGDAAASVGVVAGRIEATALRVHGASAGGRFIEPVAGTPRIVSGTVEAIDKASVTIAVQSVVPMHVALEHRADLEQCPVGSLVNFHVRSDCQLCPDACPGS